MLIMKYGFTSLNSCKECPSSHYFLPICVLLAHVFLQLASQEPQHCLKKSSRMPLIEFVEFMEFIEFVGLKRQSRKGELNG